MTTRVIMPIEVAMAHFLKGFQFMGFCEHVSHSPMYALFHRWHYQSVVRSIPIDDVWISFIFFALLWSLVLRLSLYVGLFIAVVATCFHVFVLLDVVAVLAT